MSKLLQLSLCFSLLAQSSALTAMSSWCCRSRQRSRVAPVVVRATPVLPPPAPVAEEPPVSCKEYAVALGSIASGTATLLTGVALIDAGASKEPRDSNDWITMGMAFGVSSALTGACCYCSRRLGQTGAVVPLQTVDHDHH